MEPLSASQREALEEAVRSYEAAVSAVSGVLRARGISEATASTFRLGVVTDPHPGHARYQDMLAIPYLDRNGKPLSLRFRCMEQHDHREHHHGKYNSMKGEPARTFNISAVHQARDIIHVTEGEFDAMILNQEGFPAIGIPGAQGWRSHHRRMLAGFSRVFVWPDGDDAGADFGRKVTNAMRSAKAVRVPMGQDVNALFLAGGRQALSVLVDAEDDRRAAAIAAAPDF